MSNLLDLNKTTAAIRQLPQQDNCRLGKGPGTNEAPERRAARNRARRIGRKLLVSCNGLDSHLKHICN
jgi:hypothetical protein